MQSTVQRAREINAIAAISLMSGASGKKLVRDKASSLTKVDLFVGNASEDILRNLEIASSVKD